MTEPVLNLTKEQWAEVNWDNWSSGYHARKALADLAALFAENERLNARIAELEAVADDLAGALDGTLTGSELAAALDRYAKMKEPARD